jgi:YesN/AraC family two-component response regulator
MRRYNILIVDDSPYNLFVLEELLGEMENIDLIKTALNGKEALNIVKDTLDPFK